MLLYAIRIWLFLVIVSIFFYFVVGAPLWSLKRKYLAQLTDKISYEAHHQIESAFNTQQNGSIHTHTKNSDVFAEFMAFYVSNVYVMLMKLSVSWMALGQNERENAIFCFFIDFPVWPKLFDTLPNQKRQRKLQKCAHVWVNADIPPFVTLTHIRDEANVPKTTLSCCACMRWLGSTSQLFRKCVILERRMYDARALTPTHTNTRIHTQRHRVIWANSTDVGKIEEKRTPIHAWDTSSVRTKQWKVEKLKRPVQQHSQLSTSLSSQRWFSEHTF